MAQDVVEVAQEGAAARQDNTLVDDIGSELGSRVLERDLDGLDLVSTAVDPDLHALVDPIVSWSEQ